MDLQTNHYNCIYMYINKINNKRYVGKAKNFNKRHKEHKNSSNNKNNKGYDLPLHKAIRKYGIDNFEIKILAENISNEKINEYEIFFIKRYDTLIKNGKGYNIAIGGDGGNTFLNLSDEKMKEIKDKMSKNNKGENNPFYGKHHSDEIKNNHSEFMKGNNFPCKKVIQYDLDGNLIRIWDSIKQASDELNICNTSITRCCKGNRNKAGEFIWKYYKEEK